MFIAQKTDDGRITGKISFYCKASEVSRQAFYDYLERKDEPWKYQALADAMMKIHAEDECNADYGRVRMYQALTYRQEIGEFTDVHLPCEATVRKVMEEINLIHKPKRKLGESPKLTAKHASRTTFSNVILRLMSRSESVLLILQK